MKHQANDICYTTSGGMYGTHLPLHSSISIQMRTDEYLATCSRCGENIRKKTDSDERWWKAYFVIEEEIDITTLINL